MPEIKKSLSALDADISRSDSYINKKQLFLDSLKAMAVIETDDSRRQEVYTDLSAQFRQLDSDSAIYYALLANALLKPEDEGSTALRARLQLSQSLSTSGIFNEALSLLSDIDADNLTESQKIDFWKASRMLYAYAISYISTDNPYTDIYRRKYRQSDDSLLKYLPEKDNFRNFIKAERLVEEGRLNEAKTNLTALMEEVPMESNVYGMAAYQLAIVNRQNGDLAACVDALSKSARSDIMGAVKEGIALPTLANVLYSVGDLENAFRYIDRALEEANNAHVRMRTVSLAESMAMIDRAYKKELEASRHARTVFLTIAVCLLAIVSVLSGFLIKNARETRQKERHLASLSKKLQANMGNFMGMCANYAERMEQIAKLVTRKIKASQQEDLLKLFENGKIEDVENEEFYKLVDKAILDIFPDYIERINVLLLPDKRITPTGSINQALLPELRIYACVMLGVDQSAKIAQILHYSVNTVYAYRNRMRKRAINRDTFDSDVAQLSDKED